MLTSLVSLQEENIKRSEKSVKTINIEGEHLHIFRMTWGISIKFSVKMWLMIIMKVTKNQGCTLSKKHIGFWKNHKGEGGGRWNCNSPCTPAILGLRVRNSRDHGRVWTSNLLCSYLTHWIIRLMALWVRYMHWSKKFVVLRSLDFVLFDESWAQHQRKSLNRIIKELDIVLSNCVWSM